MLAGNQEPRARGGLLPLVAPLLSVLLFSTAAALFTVATPAQAACNALPTTVGTATLSSVSVPAAGNYRVWARIIAPATTSSAVYMQVDNTFCSLSLGGGRVTTGALTWVDYQNGDTTSIVTLKGLASGAHVVTLAGKDAGVSVDKLLFLTDTSCTPTGDGSNCQANEKLIPTASPGSTAVTRGHNTPWLLGLVALIFIGLAAWFVWWSPYLAPLLAKLNLTHTNKGMPRDSPVSPSTAELIYPQPKTPPEEK